MALGLGVPEAAILIENKSTNTGENIPLLVTSPQIAFEDYPGGDITLEQVMHIMVGDLQRIRIYPEKGYQIFQEIPDGVWRAWERLVELGFDEHMVR